MRPLRVCELAQAACGDATITRVGSSPGSVLRLDHYVSSGLKLTIHRSWYSRHGYATPYVAHIRALITTDNRWWPLITADNIHQTVQYRHDRLFKSQLKPPYKKAFDNESVCVYVSTYACMCDYVYIQKCQCVCMLIWPSVPVNTAHTSYPYTLVGLQSDYLCLLLPLLQPYCTRTYLYVAVLQCSCFKSVHALISWIHVSCAFFADWNFV